MRTVDGEMGLSFEIPEEFQVRRAGAQLRVFSPLRERTRSPIDITISVAEKEPSIPGAKKKEIAQRMIHYLISDEEGGSGGAAVHLRAWVASNGRFIALDSVAQPDSGGDGEFRSEWAILPTLRWQPAK